MEKWYELTEEERWQRCEFGFGRVDARVRDDARIACDIAWIFKRSPQEFYPFGSGVFYAGGDDGHDIY